MGDFGDERYRFDNYNYNKTHNELDPHVSLAGVALVMGLLSIPLCFFLNIGVIIGGIAIVLAILSKGAADKILPQAKRAILYGSFGIVLGYGVFAYNLYSVLTNPASRRQLNEMSEQINGVSFDDMLRQLGVSVDG
ncbi:MAG: hypothetical protein K6E91_12060 [Butyrivibrio sp.]|nr:hypothetical protein [Butyrivibrio sp.]